MTAAIDLTGVEFGYDRNSPPVLAGVTAAVEAGSAIAIVGANGSGKTTLTRLMVALEQPWSGAVTIAGRVTTGLTPSDLASSVAYAFQHPARQLFARSVIDEVAFGPRELGKSRPDARTVAAEALELVGLEGVAQVHPHDLPAWEQKLVALAAAVAQGPKVLILDEPTQGLDRAALLQVSEILGTLRVRGVTVVAVTHDMTFVAEAFSRVWVVADRTVVADTPVEELFTNPERAHDLGVSIPPVPTLAMAMGWGADRFRIREAVAMVGGVRGATESTGE